MFLEVLAWSVMVGVGESYLVAFALAAGIEEWQAALVATVPVLAGSVLQMASPRGVAWVGSNRRWTVACVVVQALCYLPLVLGALRGQVPVVGLFLVVSLYWGAGLGAGPAWNTWVEALVPRRIRARFFAERSRASQVVTGAALLASGAFLDSWTEGGRRMEAFALLFALACAARLVSAGLMARQREGASMAAPEKRIPIRQLFDPARTERDGRLLVFMLTATFTVYLSAPLFAPFLLEKLCLGYREWVVLLAIPYLARIFILPLWGRISERFGATALLWIGGVGIAPLPWLWALPGGFPYLLGVALLSGITWAAYELATFLLFFEAIRREERTSVLTTFHLLRAVCMVGGSLVAAGGLVWLGSDRSGYERLFTLATMTRLAALVMLVRFAGWPGAGAPARVAP